MYSAGWVSQCLQPRNLKANDAVTKLLFRRNKNNNKHAQKNKLHRLNYGQPIFPHNQKHISLPPFWKQKQLSYYVEKANPPGWKKALMRLHSFILPLLKWGLKLLLLSAVWRLWPYKKILSSIMS